MEIFQITETFKLVEVFKIEEDFKIPGMVQVKGEWIIVSTAVQTSIERRNVSSSLAVIYGFVTNATNTLSTSPPHVP